MPDCQGSRVKVPLTDSSSTSCPRLAILVIVPDTSPEEPTPSQRGEYAPGNLIASKYRLENPIGEGGMGTVWLAENTTLHVKVAIKLVRKEIAGSEEAAQRLLNEARAAAQIDHASIVRVHDFGQTDRGDPFIVMQFLEGDSLDDVLARDPVPGEVFCFCLRRGAAINAQQRPAFAFRHARIVAADEGPVGACFGLRESPLIIEVPGDCADGSFEQGFVALR